VTAVGLVNTMLAMCLMIVVSIDFTRDLKWWSTQKQKCQFLIAINLKVAILATVQLPAVIALTSLLMHQG